MEYIHDKNVLKTLIKVIYLIDSKDNYTKKHCENVSRYALLLGKGLGLEKDDLDIIEIGAMLHDVGKIGIPDYILIKNSSLTYDEFELMKRHVTIGEALLPNEGYDKIKNMIRSHHERIDGRGYPDGLKGSNIPYFARILSVADAFDAMTTQRSYNNPKTLDEAFNELLKVSSKQIKNENEFVQQLDSHLVRVFIQLIKNDPEIMQEFKEKDLKIVNSRKNKKNKF